VDDVTYRATVCLSRTSLSRTHTITTQIQTDRQRDRQTYLGHVRALVEHTHTHTHITMLTIGDYVHLFTIITQISTQNSRHEPFLSVVVSGM